MTTDFPEIPGFDTALALRRLDNNGPLYCRLLGRFEQTCSSAPADIASRLAESDYETAGRCAHTVRGLAGNIGFRPLEEAAHTLETLCRTGASGPEAAETLILFSRALEEALTRIRGYFAANAPSAKPAPNLHPEKPVAL